MTNKINFFFSLMVLLVFSSCYSTSKISSFENPVEIKSDTLSFEITAANNIVFKTILNGVDTLDLFFDSGGTELVLKHTAIREKTSLLDGKNKNYKGENYEPLENYNSIQLGSLSWDSLTVYPVELLPADTDGHFGWNLFDGKVVELDYENQWMIVHTDCPKIPEGYGKLAIEYTHTLFCIQGAIDVGGTEYSNRYLFDTGFQRAVVLDKDLRVEEKFPNNLPVIKESVLRNSEGTKFVNKVVEVDAICFDDACAPKVPVQLFATPNPVRFKTHILGNEILIRFNTFLDFQNNFVYLKSNKLMKRPYVDAS